MNWVIFWFMKPFYNLFHSYSQLAKFKKGLNSNIFKNNTFNCDFILVINLIYSVNYFVKYQLKY